MARLYEAEHLRVDCRYAVKVIHDDLARSPDLLARFEREARANGRIKSKHVVNVIDVLRTPDGRPCIVTELLEGEDLQAELNRGKLGVARAVPIARQICRAVAAAHAAGVVHRDLKPSNVYLSRAGGEYMVKVLDFGVAKVAEDDQLTRTDAVVGTPAYMSPEQARRANEAGPLCDVYSIGAVMYHMLTGEPPYGKAPASSRFAMLLHEEPPRPREIDPEVPEGIEAVIQHAMARDPALRPPSADALEAELAAFDGGAPLVAVDPQTPAEDPEDSIEDPVDHDHTLHTQAAVRMTMRARAARPAAAVLATASTVAAALWMAALLAELVGSAGGTTGGERTLIGLFALATAVGVALIHARVLKPAWRSSTAVDRHALRVGTAMLAALATLGLVELLVRGISALFGWGPGGWLAQVILAGLAAALALLWKRLGAGDRLRRVL
jgi:serine/threonine-protein kinase